MDENGFVNVYCYNPFFQGLCKKGEAHEDLKVFEEMKSYGISPDAYTYNSLTERC